MIDYSVPHPEWEGIVNRTAAAVVANFPELSRYISFGAYIEPENYFVSYIFPREVQLKFAEKKGKTEEICKYHKALLSENGYPSEGIKNCGFASQEDCDKNYKGNWWYYFK